MKDNLTQRGHEFFTVTACCSSNQWTSCRTSHNDMKLSLQTMKKLWWKFKTLVLFLKLQCLLLKWTLYHICHKGMESCFLKEWILINQVLFSVWISKASCWNEFHYDRVCIFVKECLMRMSFLKSHSSSLIQVSKFFSWNEQINILSHISQCYEILFSWKITVILIFSDFSLEIL